MAPPSIAFNFGHNWQEFSAHALNGARVAQSRRHFGELFSGIPLQGSSFLDIGFGQGLSLLAAAAAGAEVVGCDINPTCAEVLARNRGWFQEIAKTPAVFIGSILDPKVVADLLSASPHSRGYQIVHSWGVLHHTGDMYRAISHAAALVAPGGYFVLAIYNRHWTSPIWRQIKKIYCRCPQWIQRCLIAAFVPVIYIAKWLVTKEDPRAKNRGMEFYYDVIDWVGGYPYEYAEPDEVATYLLPLGFTLFKSQAAQVPTGCNEYIFKRSG